ncbi:hypothetical protein DBR23_15310 [Acidovorax sp. HMWF018]|uniref:hypothetical protein n=1 Tax=Comamonadaceae TaxID=80864 RepID=UPI000D3A1E5A|nr:MULTISPECIES: hypothetical protein [Comamonadaceae]MBI2724744.1 hypothetical protein [Polaromonas sp.]PTT38147.1 hypothetical protein DBR23_15310 [Acidovorax sp. HMWF018]
MQTFKQIKKYGSRALVAVSAGAFGTAAMAQTATNPINQMLEAIGLDGVTASIIAVCLIIVGIALAMKGPDVAKRVIRKV